jgi:hypothetical protein
MQAETLKQALDLLGDARGLSLAPCTRACEQT